LTLTSAIQYSLLTDELFFMANRIVSGLTGIILLSLSPLTQAISTVLSPKEADWVAAEFTFNNGEKLKDLRIHYYTLGDSNKPAVLLLHGTNQPIKALLAQGFGGELFGPGQALDISKYFIIMPESIGSGKSSKPSDGLRMAFPHYDYNDMVTAQYRLIKEGWAFPIYVWSWGIRWGACKPGCGVKNTLA